MEARSKNISNGPIKNIIKTFFKSESSIGICLMLATIAALLIANSQNYQTYQDFFEIKISLKPIGEGFILRDLINDGLMSLFFLLVGLELKREVLIGKLSSKNKFALPAIAAWGGVLVPMLIFFYCNFTNSQNLRGFAIPCATDIAFAYGMISFFGKYFSNSLKIFVVALAVLDDLFAIALIALFYSNEIHFSYLAIAALVIFALALLNSRRSNKISFYLILGFFLWLMILKSGIHTTLAGVILALLIPLESKNKKTANKTEPMLASFAHKITSGELFNFTSFCFCKCRSAN